MNFLLWTIWYIAKYIIFIGIAVAGVFVGKKLGDRKLAKKAAK